MPQQRRVARLSVALATALGVGLSLSVGLGAWGSTGAVTVTKAALPRAAATPSGSVHPGAQGSASGGPTSPSLAKQLRSMDPKSLDASVASKEADARRSPGSATPTKGHWFLGEVGTYVVGRGIPPGTYESAGALGGRTCQWARGKGTGTKDATAGAGSSSSRTVVTIRKTDKYFQTKDCSNWHKIS
jgi:hypothetical protein